MMSLVVAGLATTLVVVFVDRSGHHTTLVDTSTPAATTPAATVPPAALDGEHDVTVTVVSAEYGTTWPGPRLVAGQTLGQRWTIDCREDTCRVDVGSGHVTEDPDGASVSTTDGRVFSVAGATAASPDSAGAPAGCGAVNATDVQRLTLTMAAGSSTFSGRYELHHPVVHVEGPVGDATGVCDSFNVVLDLAGARR